jgi:dTDP-4-dehydrorhamnose reductase
MKKVAVIGGNGQLGSDVAAAFAASGDDVVVLTHDDMEISSIDSVSQCLRAHQPQIIVNTAAMHHVEQCETDPARAFAVNGLGARNLALLARDLDSVLIHISTDYVFDGKKGQPYEESDAPGPLNVYGNTKLSGEHFVRSTEGRYFILRTSAIYGKKPCRAKGGRNFVDLMIHLANTRGAVRVVDSEVVSPTPTCEIARQIVVLSRCEAYGLYHATAEGRCSWYEFAREIFAVTNTKVDLSVAGPNEFPAKVARPMFSVLENSALKIRGLNVFRSWQEGLREYFQQPSFAGASAS